MVHHSGYSEAHRAGGITIISTISLSFAYISTSPGDVMYEEFLCYWLGIFIIDKCYKEKEAEAKEQPSNRSIFWSSKSRFIVLPKVELGMSAADSVRIREIATICPFLRPGILPSLCFQRHYFEVNDWILTYPSGTLFQSCVLRFDLFLLLQIFPW